MKKTVLPAFILAISAFVPAHAVTVVAPVVASTAAITAAAAAISASNATIAANNAARAAHQDKQQEGINLERIPSIELNCEKIGSAVFWNTGELEGDSVEAFYVDRVDNAIYFTNGVKLTGIIAGDSLLFDTAILSVHGTPYTCTGE